MTTKRYDLGIHISEDDDLEDIASRAQRLGCAGIALLVEASGPGDVEGFEQRLMALEAGITVHAGALLTPATPGELKSAAHAVREHVDVLAVAGGDAQVNRAAVENPRVDILLAPYAGRDDAGIDHVIAQKAADNHVAIGIEIRSLCELRGKARAHMMASIRECLRVAQKRDASMIVVSGARTAIQLRSPRDMAAVGDVLGLEDSERAVSTVPQDILEHARQIRSGTEIRPGVRRVNNDE